MSDISLENNNQLPSLENNNQLPSLENNNQLPSLENNNQLPSIENNNQLPSIENNNQLPSLENNNQLPSIENNNNQLPSLENNNQLPSLENNNNQLPSIENNNIPSTSIENNNIPSTSIENNNIPSTSIENNNIPSTSIENNNQLLSLENNNKIENNNNPLSSINDKQLQPLLDNIDNQFQESMDLINQMFSSLNPYLTSRVLNIEFLSNQNNDLSGYFSYTFLNFYQTIYKFKFLTNTNPPPKKFYGLFRMFFYPQNGSINQFRIKISNFCGNLNKFIIENISGIVLLYDQMNRVRTLTSDRIITGYSQINQNVYLNINIRGFHPESICKVYLDLNGYASYNGTPNANIDDCADIYNNL